MKSSNHSDAESKDYPGGSSSTIGQEDLIPIFLRRLNDLNIRVGTRTRFLIELDDATGVQVRWYHNNVEAYSERYQYIHEGGFYCLDIVPVTLFDEGLWVCTAQNYAGKSSTAAHLSLTVPKAFKKPIFVEQLKAVLTQRGIVSLECKVIGVPTPKLRWYKDDKEIKAGDIFALTANSEEDCLGIYTCEATNVMGTALSTSKIQVTHTPLDGNRDADSLIPYGPPPKFMKFLKDSSGKVGSVLFLECQVEVPPWPRSIGWYNDNGIVNEGPLYHLMADGLGMYGVEIKSLRADHSTTWKCIATSSTGAKAVTSCVVSVSYPKNYRVPRFLESLRAIMTDEGLVSFECKVIGYPTPQLSWFKDGKQLQPGDVYELTGSKSLGSYCCVARNCMGETSSIAELTIEDIQNQLNESEKLQLTSNTQPPRFLLGLKSIEANINESFVFTIKVTTESTPSISWYKEDEQLTESNRYQFSTEDNGTYMLSILPLEIDDQAEWKCVAINKYGQTVTSSFLKLNIPKTFKSPRFLEELRIAFSNEGSVNLECKVIGVPQPQLKWFKDGQELNPGDMHKIISGQSGTCCLGTYTCQAHNCMGTVSSSATLLTMEDKSTVKSCASEEYLSVGNPLVRNESLSTIPEERTSQMEKSYTIEEPADISFSFDGKEVTVSLYETPDLTHDEALQIIEMYADELSEHISEDNVVDLPSLRIVKESSISGPVMMEALVIDVPIDFCRQQIVSDTEFDGVSLTEDITLANNDKSDSICENSLEYFSDHLSSGNSKREVFYSASETTPKNLSILLKQQSVEDEDGHQSFQTPKLFMSDSDDQILTQLKLDEIISPQNSRHVIGSFARSESNNTEEEVSETLAEIENEPPLSHNYCASEIVTQSDEDGLYSTVLNKIRGKGMVSVELSSEEDDVLKIISRPNVDEFLKYMKIILEGAIVKMQTHENFNFTSTTTELERSIQALHSLAWKFIEETERNHLTDLDKNTADNVSSLMTAINASLLALEQIDDPFGVSDNVLNEIQSSVCFDLETLNNSDLPASVILDRLSDQIKNFIIVVNRQVTRVTEQRIIAVLQNTIGTTLVYIKTLQQNNSKIKCVDVNLLAPLFSMVQPLETILNDIALIEESSIDDNKPNLKLKQILIPPISSIAFALDNLNTALKSDSSNDDQDLKDIYDRINESTNQFMIIASQGMDSNKIAECFISFTKPINDLCCHLRRLGRSTENIVSSDYGSDDKLLLDFETLFDELMMDIDTLINNVNFVQDSENNMNPLGSLLEPLQDMKIGLFQVNQVLLSNQTGSTMSYEVVSCFEHLSQQLVQLNNCIVNQSIVEETDKEIPFESSIKMMQKILFDDAIDDLGVNGILFGSVMKPLLQLQNLIVSKMASVESDLSFSEHTDVTGGACDTQSLSLSLSNNAQTVFNKTIDENSKNGLTESSIIDKDCDKQNNIHTDNSEINKDSIHFENNINNDLIIKRGFECDIGETFKYEEPNIITSEDDRDNSGFEALFDETDLETISDFVEDRCMENIINSKIDHKLSDLFMSENDIETVQKEINDIIPEHILESLEKNNQQDFILNSPVDLFDELQETLKNMSEVAQDKLTEIYALDNNTSSINDLQKNNSKYDDQLCDKTNNLLDNSLDVAKLNNSTIIRSDELTKQNIIELSEMNSEELNQCNKIILKTDQNETLKNKDISISDQDIYKEEKVFEVGKVEDLVDNFECLDSDKSISNNTVITVNEISESSEVKMKEVDNTENLETTVNLISSTTGNVSQIVDVSDENSSFITSINNVVSKINDNDEALTDLSDIKNDILDSNIKYVSNEDIIIVANKLNDSEKLNLLNYDCDTVNKDALLTKKIDELSITDNFSHNAFQQDNTVINNIDSIHNLGTDMAIQVAQTSIGNEVNMEKDNKLIPMDKSTNSEELNKVLATFVHEKNDLTLATNLLIEDHNTSIVNETSNEIKQCDNRDIINKNNCTIEERETSIKEPTSSIDSIHLMTAIENNIIEGTTEIQDSNNEKLSLVKYEYNDSNAFEIDQDIDSDNISHHDMQPNINTTSTTDNKQSVSYSPISENIVNPITESNVHQTEEYVQNSSNQFIDEIQNQKNESELINEDVQQKCFNVQQKNILELSNKEVKAIDELNEQCEILSEMKLNNEIEYINSKIVLSTEIICPENMIDNKNVVEQCVLDKSNHVDGLCTTQNNIDKCDDIILPVTEVMTEKIESNILEKQLVITSSNVEENKNEAEKSKQNRKVCENNEIIDNTGTKFKTDVTNNFENLVHLTLNEEEMSSDKKINSCSENEITEISMNNEEKYINTLNKSFKNTSENTQPIDPYTFEENRVEIQFKENINSGNEHTTVLDDKDKMISNLELLESKNKVLYFPDETINNDIEKSCCEIEYIQNYSSKIINELPNIMVEHTTALICNEMISVSNVELMDSVVIDFENIKEQYEIELNDPDSKNIEVLENTIDTIDKINRQNDDEEIVINDESISMLLNTNNLINDENKGKSITKEYNEIQTLKLIDEKSNSDSYVDDTNGILKAMNNLNIENKEGNILTKSQPSDENVIKVSLTENDLIANIIDMETTKIKTDNEVDSCKTIASENDLAKHKSSFLVNDNKEDCKEITSYPNTCNKISNENNINQPKDFTECQTKAILENFDTLEKDSHEETELSNTISNEEKSSRIEGDLEVNETSECLLLNKDIDCKIMEKLNIDFSVDESLQIDTDIDIKAQQNNNSKNETLDVSVYSTEQVNVMPKNYPDKNHSVESNLTFEVQGNSSNTINDNEENEHSIIKLENINADEDILINKVKINNQIDIMTAVENNVNLLNDTIFEDGVNDLSAKESLSALSIMTELHCIEKVAANQIECVMLENTNILKQDELNATENVNQYAQVEHELNIAAIGNIIIDYDSIKEHSITSDDEKNSIENATMNLNLDDHSFKIVSTIVDVLNAPTNDTIINNEQTVMNEVSKDSISVTTLLCENKNPENLMVVILNDETENSDNFVKENVQCKIEVDIKQTLSSKSIESPSTSIPTNNISVKENKINTTEIINKTLDERNVMLSDENKNTEENITELISEEILENVLKTDDKNKNIKNNEIDNNDEKLHKDEIEIDKTKRRSNKKKSSLPSEDKKSPSPDKTKNDVIDKTKNIDIRNKKLSDDNNDTEKVIEVELSKLEPKISLDNNKNTEEVIEKDVLIDDQNQNQKDNKIDNGDIQFTESEIELNKTKRGSKKKKPSLPSEDKKSPSPDKTIDDVIVSEKEIDKTKNIDTSNVEKNKILSDDNNDTEKVEIELSKVEPTISLDNNKNTEEVIEKDVLIDDQNQNQKDNKIDNGDIQFTESKIELNKTKRGSKKKKPSLPSEDKKSPSLDKTIDDVIVSEKEIDKTKNIDTSNVEKNKILSDDNNDTEKVEVELSKVEPTIPLDNNKNTEEVIEKDVLTDDQNKRQKNDKIDIDDNIKSTENNVELVKTKRGSKKNESRRREEDKKSPSPEKTKNNKLSDNNNDTEKLGTKLESEVPIESIIIKAEEFEVKSKTNTGNYKNITKKIEKDVSNNTQTNNQNNDDIGKAEIKSTENCVEKDGTKRGSKRDVLSSRPEGKKTTSPDKTKKITEHLKIQSLDENNTIIELEKLQNKRDESKILRESKQTLQCKETEPSPTSQKLSKNNYESIDSCRSKISLENNSRVGMDRKQMNETRSFVDVLVDDGGQRVAKKELKSTGLAELDNVGVPEIPSLGKRPVNRYILDVTDAHKLRPNTLAYRSLTPDPLTSYRSPTPDHLTSYRSLTPDCPSYKSYLTPRSKYTTSTRYAGSSDRELYGGSSSSRSSRSSSRSMSPYPSESRISTRNLWPTSIAAYRCLSETSVPLSPRLLEEEKTSGWSHTSYGATTRRRRGSDSFLHDSGVRDGDYYSSWRLYNSRSAAYGATEDLCRTKEAFKGLYFCVRMIDQTVSSGARVKFWCSVIGHPEPRIQWYRDGQKLNSFTYNSSARYQTKYDGGLAQLIIDNAQSGDSGEYTCVAANNSDRISTTGFLTVYTSPSVFRKPLLQPSLSVDSFESGHGAYSRTSHDLRLPTNAKFDFGCRKFESDLVSRRPEYPKFVSSIIADDVATCGGTIALQVRVQGSPVPNVTWMRESRPLPRLSGKYVYLDEGGLYTLLVMDSTTRDGGTYVCRACNLYGAADAEKAVSVVSPQDYSDRRGVKPAIIVSRPNDRLNVAVGEDITVTLRVAGEPKPKVIWMRGSRDVTFFDRSSKETVNDYVMLSIKKAQPSDAGTYFIIAKNVYGSDRAFVTVGVRERARSLTPPRIRNTIGRWSRPIGGRGGRGGCANNEVPGPVRSEPTVTDRTNNRISLQWDRPEKPETVLVYRVETRSADEECWRPVGMTPTNTIDVYNLKPGYRYQFRVAARNRFGWSQSVAAKGYVDVFEPKCLPEFRQPLPGQTRVLLRHSATLQCHVRGIPEPRVTWFKDGEPLLASDRHAVRRTDTGKCTLTIEDAAEEDAGRYSCEAVNDQGRVCTLTVVQVIANRRIVEAERRLQGCLMKNNNFKESAPVFTKHLIDRRVEINSTVRLSCQVNGLPVPLVLWYKDGQPLDFSVGGTEGDRKPPVRDDSDDFYTLELTGVKYDDSGAYAAVASNAIGKASTRCVLEVFNKNRTDPAVPTFIFGLPTTSKAVDSIVLSAQIDAFRPVKVEWFRDGVQLRNGRRVDIITDHDGNLELRIACVTIRDSGTYMLRVSNDTGTVESRCDVNVVEREHNDTGMEQISLINHLYSKKPKFVVKPKFQEVEEGQEVIIDSEIVGDPLPKITWLRDGLKPEYYRDNSEFLCISNGNRYQLKIPHAKLTHTGTYTLLAANPHGQIKALISLQVYSTGHCKKKMENGTNHATVERLPRISRGLVDIECRENDGVTFECKLNITQETDIRWQKDGKLVRLGKQIKSQLIDGDTARLEISTVSPLHEGLYTCTAFNELGQDSTSARLILLSDSQETAKLPQSNGQQNTMIGSPILAGESNDRCTKRLKRSSAPKFYAVLHDRIADIGETVRFQCSVSGHPPPWSSWEKDGQPIGVNSRMRIREDDDYRSLEICDVTSDDTGLYRITVENKFGKIQATARLEVLTHNQITNDVQITSSSNGRRQSGSAACAGENFTLSCDIRGNSMSDVTWYKNDVEVKPDDRVTSSLDDLAARLSISNLESADTGVYTCVARCESGVTRCSTELCVFDMKPGTDSYLQPPIFVEGLVPKRTADEGEPVQLTVRLQGAVPMSALWFKNDVLVPDCADFEYVVTEDRGEFGLSIIDPFIKDSGIYSCKVANSFGQAVSSGKLVINEMSSGNQVPMVIELNNNLQDIGEKTACDSPVNTKTALPASILSGPCDTTVLRGAKVVLKTSYKGDPEPCVQWLRAGKVLESDAHLCITNGRGVSSLTIDSITADDCGKYVVRVDNGHGNDFHFASVAVEGPPDPPAGRPVVSVSETSADVTWSSPAYDGGCMVTGYGVEVRPFNQSDWKLVADKCHSLSHIVRGLAPGESYVFRVRAENMHGSSEASLESTPVYILQTDYGNTLWPKTVNIENGDLFDKQYEMLDELGKGRYGVVYKVKERETNKYYAAKFVRCIKSTDKEKAQEEVDIMNCLRHPKLLQLDAAFDKPREVVLVTEYISGGELFERVVADDFTLTEKDCILFTRQICEGVDYMHKQNVVHLDLKPENIMCQSRTSHYIKLIDFGLAQKIIPGQPMRVLFGTPEFIPPEIIGYEPIGFESDMWSVGVICYVLLSGLSPFMGDNDSETFTNITKAEFDFDDEAFDAVSQDAKDFISALLIKRKELRLTARECLKHKWLAQQDMDMSCVILSTDKLKKFIIRRKWQKTGNAIRALGRMATLSAASRRGVVGGGSAGGGVGGVTADGNGARSILQKLKMTSLREEESTVESPSEGQEITITETTKSGSCHKACDDRSDSGFSECPSVASPTAMLIRTPECQSVISEEKPPVSNPDCSPPPPTHRSPPTITDRHSSIATLRPSSPATLRPSSPATLRPSSPATLRPSSPANLRPSSPAARRTLSPANRCPSTSTTCSPPSPATHGSSSPATRGPSSPAVRGSSYSATRGSSHTPHPRSPLPRNRHDTTHPIHDVPLPTGTGVSVLKTNRMMFDGGRRDGSASSAGMSVSGGVQRKEPIRIQTADNFKKAVAFWKQ